MPQQDYAASVHGVAIRVTRLNERGELLSGPLDSYITPAFIRTSFTPNMEAGDELTEKNARGEICVSYKSPDTLKDVSMELAICDPDPEFTALLGGGLMLSRDLGGKQQTVGWASAQVGEDPSGNGVAVEVWSRAIVSGRAVGYFHWVFPLVKTRLTGDRVIENGLLATAFEGTGIGNINFRSGPDGTWGWPAATDRPYLYARTSSVPGDGGLRGFYQWDPATGAPKSGSPVDSLSTIEGNRPGVNVTGGQLPYPYDSSATVDRILAFEDYATTATGAVEYPAAATTGPVKNTPSSTTGVAQNPVAYDARATGPAGP